MEGVRRRSGMAKIAHLPGTQRPRDRIEYRELPRHTPSVFTDSVVPLLPELFSAAGDHLTQRLYRIAQRFALQAQFTEHGVEVRPAVSSIDGASPSARLRFRCPFVVVARTIQQPRYRYAERAGDAHHRR